MRYNFAPYTLEKLFKCWQRLETNQEELRLTTDGVYTDTISEEQSSSSVASSEVQETHPLQPSTPAPGEHTLEQCPAAK